MKSKITPVIPSAVHVRIEYPDAIASKKILLLLQMHLLESIKDLKKYRNLRWQELKLKTELKKNLKEIITLVNVMKKDFPSAEIPAEFKDIQKRSRRFKVKDVVDSNQKKIKTITVKEVSKKGSHVENELERIRAKLKELEARG